MLVFKHPYIDVHFDFTIKKKYLIIGTFPPCADCEERIGEIKFFYGNAGSLWSIISNTKLYPNYNFKEVNQIKKWLNDYSIGVTDVLKSCKRTIENKCSTQDKHLIIQPSDLDERLKNYVLKHQDYIQTIFFTSGSESKSSNSAFYWFKKLMADELKKIPSHKLVKLPSPSGSANTSLFKGKKEKYGLVDEFYNFLAENYPNAINFAQQTWEQKKKLPKGEKIKRLPEDRQYSTDFKQWFYGKYLKLQNIEQ